MRDIFKDPINDIPAPSFPLFNFDCPAARLILDLPAPKLFRAIGFITTLFVAFFAISLSVHHGCY